MRLNEQTMRKTAVVVALAVLANMLWGSAASVIKTGYKVYGLNSADTVSMILFAGIRFFLAGIITVFLGSLAGRKLLLPRKSALPKIAVLALFQTVIQYVLFYIGCANASGTNVAIAASTSAFISILFSSLLFRQEKLTARKMLGCLLGFSGVVLINLKGGSAPGLDMTLAGEGAIILSVCAFSVSNAFTKKFSVTEDPVMLCGYQFVLGGAVMILAALALGGRLGQGGATGSIIIVYLAMVSAAAFSLTSLLLKYNPVSRVSIFAFLNPVFGVILSILLLGESGQDFGVKGIAALALVCAGVLVVYYKRRQPETGGRD